MFSPVTGTDRWFFKLKNYWEVYEPLLRKWNHGYVLMNFVQPGMVTDVRLVTPPVGYASELQVDWWCDRVQSGLWYELEVYVTGPEGVPYW